MSAGRSGVCVAFAILVFLPPVSGAAGDWPMSGHDPGQSRCSGTTVPDGPGVQWIFSEQLTTMGDYYGFYGDTVVADGRVFIMDKYDLTAISADNGTRLWKTKVIPSWAPPAVANGTVYVGKAGGDLGAYNSSNGSLLWTHASDVSGEISFLVVDGETVLMGISSTGENSTILAIDRLNGTELWRKTGGGTGFAAEGGFVFVSDKSVRACNESNGVALWDSGLTANSSLTAASGLVFFASGDELVALHQKDGSIAWRSHLGVIADSTRLAVNRDHVFVLYWSSYGTGTILFEFNIKTGGLDWRRSWSDMNGFPYFTLADDKVLMTYGTSMPVYVNTSHGSSSSGFALPAKLVALDNAGKELWNFSFIGKGINEQYPTSLVAGEGKIFVGLYEYSETIVRHIFAFGQDTIRSDIALYATISPADGIYMGEELTVTFSVVNRGTEPAENVGVLLSFFGGPVYPTVTDPIGPIEPGGTATLNYSWTFEDSNAYPVFASAFAANFLVDRTPGDNFVLLMPPIEERPNLAISDFNADYYPMDDQVHFYFSVADQNGISFSDQGLNFSVLLLIDGTDRTTFAITDFKYYQDKYGEKPLLPGRHTLQLIIDPEKQINETNESDNQRSISVFVPETARPNEPATVHTENLMLLVGAAVALMSGAAIFILFAWRKPPKGSPPAEPPGR
jgi:outer membrane protein assembly factor BamB